MNKPVVLALILAFGCGRGDPEARPVVVFAASSLRELVTDVTAEWTGRTGVRMQLRIEATSTLARQIRDGAAADLFLAADPEWLKSIPTLARFDWLSNRLVCVVPRDSAPVDLAKIGSLALANEEVPAGKYAKAALIHLGRWPPRRVLYGSNVRDVLAKVSQGGAEAAIVYATDAPVDPGVKVAFAIPEESHPPIRYAVGLITEHGRALFDALKKPWTREIAARLGFGTPP
jgi:molybdate transport system substrate-binding protein